MVTVSVIISIFLSSNFLMSGGGGYAREMGPAFQEAQDALFRAECPNADIIITTALIPGRPAPKILKEDMIKSMKPGSVIVDLASPTGGNAWSTVDGEKIITENGVTILGLVIIFRLKFSK